MKNVTGGTGQYLNYLRVPDDILLISEPSDELQNIEKIT